MSLKHLNSTFVSLLFFLAPLDVLTDSSYNPTQDFNCNRWSTVPKSPDLELARLVLELGENSVIGRVGVSLSDKINQCECCIWTWLAEIFF